MFNSFPDKLKYQQNIGTDDFGNTKYATEETRNFRFIKSKQTLRTDNEGTATIFNRIYHSELEVNDGDKIDGRRVEAAAPVRGLTGKLHYWKVWVI